MLIRPEVGAAGLRAIRRFHALQHTLARHLWLARAWGHRVEADRFATVQPARAPQNWFAIARPR